MKQFYLIFWLFLFFTVSLFAQKVTNVLNKQEQSTIIVSYDLETKSPCKIALYVSTNGGTNWQGPLKKVSGDIGANVSSGSKAITWNVLEEFEELSGENIVFKVSADASSTNSLANNSALKLIPKDAKSFKARGEARLATEDYKGAIADFTKAIALSPKNATLYKLRGDAYLKELDWDKAKTDYSKAIALNPNYDEAYVGRGIVNRRKFENNAAILDFTKAININPKNYDAYYSRASVFVDNKLYENALNDYNQVLKICPDDYKKKHMLNFRRGVVKVNLNDIDGAIEDLNQDIYLNPETDLGYKIRGALKLKHKNDTLGAFEDFNLHINRNIYKSESYEEISNILFYNNDFKSAILFASKGITTDSINKTKGDTIFRKKNYLIRAASFMKLKIYNKAYADYNQYIKEGSWWDIDHIFPTDERDEYYNLKIEDKALEIISNLIENNSSISYLYYVKGNMYYDKNQYNDAIKNYSQAVELYLAQKKMKRNDFEFDDYYLYYNKRASAKSELGDYMGAIADYNQAINLSGSFPPYYLSRAWNKSKLYDYRGAITDYTLYIQDEPDDTEAYLNRGDAKYNINDFKGAITDYTKVISLDPKNAEAFLWRGHAKIQIKDKIGACKDFSKAGELGEKDAYNEINANCN